MRDNDAREILEAAVEIVDGELDRVLQTGDGRLRRALRSLIALARRRPALATSLAVVLVVLIALGVILKHPARNGQTAATSASITPSSSPTPANHDVTSSASPGQASPAPSDTAGSSSASATEPPVAGRFQLKPTEHTLLAEGWEYRPNEKYEIQISGVVCRQTLTDVRGHFIEDVTACVKRKGACEVLGKVFYDGLQVGDALADLDGLIDCVLQGVDQTVNEVLQPRRRA